MTKRRDADAFLDELTELFIHEGIRDLTIGELARRMQCSRSRLYEIAPTKEQIFCSVVARFFDRALAQGRAQAALAPDAASALVDSLAVGVRASARISVAFLRDMEAIDEARQLYDTYQHERTTHFSELIAAGAAHGVFVECNAAVVAEIMFGAALHLRNSAFLARAGLTIDAAFEQFYGLLLGGLLRPGAVVREGLLRG
jgi:AcrR family transcriptional regulator